MGKIARIIAGKIPGKIAGKQEKLQENCEKNSRKNSKKNCRKNISGWIRATKRLRESRIAVTFRIFNNKNYTCYFQQRTQHSADGKRYLSKSVASSSTFYNFDQNPGQSIIMDQTQKTIDDTNSELNDSSYNIFEDDSLEKLMSNEDDWMNLPFDGKNPPWKISRRN